MSIRRRFLFPAVAAAALSVGVVAAPVGHAQSTQHKAQVTKTVKIVDANGSFAFSPKTLKIKAGTKVVWVNSSSAPHTVTSKKHGLFNKSIAMGAKITITFKHAGKFHYFCAIHPFMHGVVIVH